MNPFISYIKKLDIFSVPFTPSLSLKTKEMNSASLVGGITTLIIYSFSLFYGITLISQWHTYKMPFKISTQEKPYDEATFKNYFDAENFTDVVTIYIQTNLDEVEVIHFFKKDSIVLLPLLFNGETNETLNLIKYYNEDTQQIQIQTNQVLYESAMFLYLVSCLDNQHYLDIGQQCATQEEFEEKIKIPGIEADIDIQISKLNFQTKIVDVSHSYSFSFIQPEFSSFKLLSLQYSYYEIIEGFFQEKESQYMLTTEYFVRDQIGTINYITQYCQHYTNDVQSIYAAYYLNSSFVINSVLIQYPTVGELLANIGSITQVLLLIGVVIRYVNKKMMIYDFKVEFKKLFFPQLFQIEKRKGNRETHYYYQNKKINADSYNKFIKIIDNKIDEKLNYQNLIYEISRLEMVLEEITTQYKILQTHMKQFELELVYNRLEDEYHILNYWDSDNELLEYKAKNSLAPFSLGQSMQRQSQNFCKNLYAEKESAVPSPLPEILLLSSHQVH